MMCVSLVCIWINIYIFFLYFLAVPREIRRWCRSTLLLFQHKTVLGYNAYVMLVQRSEKGELEMACQRNADNGMVSAPHTHSGWLCCPAGINRREPCLKLNNRTVPQNGMAVVIDPRALCSLFGVCATNHHISHCRLLKNLKSVIVDTSMSFGREARGSENGTVRSLLLYFRSEFVEKEFPN